jgi:hypothetical protein
VKASVVVFMAHLTPRLAVLPGSVPVLLPV